MKAAVVSYNAFNREANGWHCRGENEVLLVQNDDGSLWGAKQSGTPQDMATEGSRLVTAKWTDIGADLLSLDLVVVYVGSYGAETIITLAAESSVPAGKMVFVMCDCNLANKNRLIGRHGYEGSRKIMCHCGGRTEMSRIFPSLMDTGLID